jgi:Rrf2 family nitric oxide-sensitive transcriptional repressor
MQLTRFTDLGLRVLMYMTQHNRPDPVTNAELASQFETPHNHVIKVVNRLAKLGWVETQRGRRGGLRLSVRPADLRLGLALRALEQTEQLVDCNHPPCVLKSRCLLKGALDEALEAFYQKMDERTLADVCRSRTGSALVTLHRKYAGISA